MWCRVKRWCKNSLTMAWAYVVGLASALYAVALQAADLLNLPDVKAQLSEVLDPMTAAWIGLGVAVVTALARLRTLRR